MKPIEYIAIFWIGMLITGLIITDNNTDRLKIDLNKLDSIVAQIEAKHALEANFDHYEAIVTAYNAEISQTDDTPTIMASGKEVYDGAIACPIMYSFGTKVEIMGRTFTCEDRMAERFRRWQYYDIYMDDKQEALDFGKQILTVKINNQTR